MKKLFGFLVMIFAFTVVITGCGGSSGSTPVVAIDDGGSVGVDTSGGSSGGDTSTYAGLSKISGSIDLDSLNSQDSAVLGKAVAGKAGVPFSKALGAVDATMNAIVKLYVVGADGELEDTGIECSLTQDAAGNVDYECDGVKDGVNYVVKYLKVTTDGKALELTANASVGVGVTVTVQEVSPKTSVVVESLVNAILDATEGVDIDQAVVNNIIEAVKVVIETLVDAGIIQIPSMIVDVEPGSTVEEVLAEDISNEDVSNTAGQILADDSVDVELSVVKSETQAAQFDLTGTGTDAGKAALIEKIFKEMLGDDDIPGFMLQFFKDVYIQDKKIDVDALITAIKNGLFFREGVTDPGITIPGGISAFNASMTELYGLLEKKDLDTLTESEKRALSEIPPVMPGLFPIAERTTWTAITTASILNVPQAIAFTIYFVDVYISDAFETSEVDANYDVTENTDGSLDYDKEEPFDFDPMGPGSLLDALGFSQMINENPEKYTGIDIFDLWLNPGTIWLEDTGQETDALNAGACWMNIADMFSETVVDLSGAIVTLTYPTTSGVRSTIDLVSQATLWGGPADDVWNNCWVLDPWMEASALIEPADPPPPVTPTPGRIISDFTSGTYTVSVTYGGVTKTKDFEKKVITEMSDKYPVLVSPLGMPHWPGENSSQAEKDAFDVAQLAYSLTLYAANVDAYGNTPGLDDNEDPLLDELGAIIVATHAKVTITWKAPDVTLPDGVKMVYNLDVGKGGCDPEITDGTGCIWDPIWNSWDKNKRLFVTSFTLPTPILKQDPADPYRYFVNVGVEFVDKKTGETLGSGGWANAEFMVADPLDTTQPFDILGAIDSVVVNDANTGDQVDSTVRDTLALKAALVSESETCDSDAIIDPCTKTTTVLQVVDVATDGSYTLSPTIAYFLDNAGTWFNIVIVLDENDDGVLNLDANGYFSEPTAWPDWEQGNIWFDTWGGSLRVGQETCTTTTEGVRECEYKDTVIIGGETVPGPNFIFEYWPEQP